MNRFSMAIVTAALSCLLSSVATAESRSSSFDWVWQTAHEQFYDAKFNGVAPDIDVPFELPYAQGRDPRKARAIDEAARLVKTNAG